MFCGSASRVSRTDKYVSFDLYPCLVLFIYIFNNTRLFSSDLYLINSIFLSSVLTLQAYVQYMKFARRAEGIKSARTVFKRAREDQRCMHHVYVAAALMEYYCTKDKNIAFRIFELGLKKFADNPDYILCYIDYLSHLNGMDKL